MMEITRLGKEELKKYSNGGYNNTVFTTYEWISFLEKNQNGNPIILELAESGRTVAVFVGMLVKKMGFKVLGSPFEGWLTPDMGFIRLEDFDINDALRSVARYAFKTLRCSYIQICDKNIKKEELDNSIKYFEGNLLQLPISSDVEKVIESFTKNGRRDVRAATRKGLEVKKVPFDREFVDNYYSQLVEVFAMQNLKPFYGKDKLYDLVDAFKDSPEKVLALSAELDNKCVATVLSFGLNHWGYYLGAASFKEQRQKLPNERLFLAFVEHWAERSVGNLDLVGYREYKMKYNPMIIDIPTVYFEKVPGMLRMKKIARKVISCVRKARGK